MVEEKQKFGERQPNNEKEAKTNHEEASVYCPVTYCNKRADF